MATFEVATIENSPDWEKVQRARIKKSLSIIAKAEGEPPSRVSGKFERNNIRPLVSYETRRFCGGGFEKRSVS
ncbi:hypothetical protein KKF38_00570 [Patescibacteria group bacterium]|nr:hypothetical protein [Patescibacteria group bacterium]